MDNYYDLLPELKFDLGEIFKPTLKELLLFERNEKIWVKLVHNPDSKVPTDEIDLSFIVEDSNEYFNAKYTLESNAILFFNLNKLSLLMTIGSVFTKEGIEILTKEA